MSDNSSSNSSARSDIPIDFTKYNRLAMEYSKVRAQVSVLKKAMQSEQKSNAEISEALLVKDQSIRRLEQEMEALKFRNSQMSVRVTVLQDEISMINSKKKNKDALNKIAAKPVAQEHEDSALEKLMIENARLVLELSKRDDRYDTENKVLKTQISAMNKEIDQLNKKILTLNAAHQVNINNMKEEQAEIKRIYEINLIKLREMEQQLSRDKETFQNGHHGMNPATKQNVQTNLTTANVDIYPFRKFFLNFLVTLRLFINADDFNLNEFIEVFDLYLCEPDIHYEKVRSVNDSLFMNSNSLDQFNLRTPSISQIFLQSCMHLFFTIESLFKEDIILESDSLIKLISSIKVAKNDFLVDIKTRNNSETVEPLEIAFNEFISLSESFENENTCLPTCSLVTLQKILKEHEMKINEYKSLNVSMRKEIVALEETVKLLEQENASYQIKLEFKNNNNNNNNNNEDIKNNIDGLLTINGNVHERLNHLGKSISLFNAKDEILAQNKLLYQLFGEKLHNLVEKKQEADSKTRNYILECHSLQRRLEYCLEDKKSLETENTRCKVIASELKEELNIVRHNYEKQITMLSEHIANIEEKFTSQSNEIQNLQQQLSGKISKKNKLK